MPGGGMKPPPLLKLKTVNDMKTESDYLLMLCDVVAAMKKDMPELNNFAIFGNVINNDVMELLAVTHDIDTDIDRIDYIELSNKSDEEIKRLMQLAITNWHDMPEHI